MSVVKTLQLNFRNEEGRPVSISVSNPVEPVDAQAVEAAMETISQKNIFVTTGGDITDKVSARLISREVSDVVVF